MDKLTRHRNVAWNDIINALLALKRDHSNYSYVVDPVLSDAIEHIAAKADAGDAYVGYGYLLLVSVVNPWYNGKARVLQEELVLRIGNTGQLPRVVTFIESLARELNCSGAYVGDSTNDGRMATLYKRRKFLPAGSLLYKSI